MRRARRRSPMRRARPQAPTLVLGAGAPRALALRGAAVAALQQEEQLALLDTARSEGCTYSAKSTLANCPATYTHTHGRLVLPRV